MSKKYEISEERLLELLEIEAEMECLSDAGVDNWWGYMDNMQEYIANALCVSEGEVKERALDFSDVALCAIKDFKEI